MSRSILPYRLTAILVTAYLALPALPARGQVTPPEEFLGYPVGADYRLTTYEQAMSYFELLASQTARMQLFDMGPTSQGRTMRYAVISSESNMVRLEEYRSIAVRLTAGQPADELEAAGMAEEGRAIVWIDAGLHSTECAPSEHLIQLAYDLISGEDSRTRRIRENVIALLVFANPDGMTMVADWYMEHVGTEFETSSTPWLYHQYVGHDNNRDSFNSSQLETQNINRIQTEVWPPNVAYNHHQRAPFPTRIWIPPYGEPTNPNKPGEVIRWENLIGAAMGQAFDAEGKPGAVSRISFDAWYPGFLTQIVVTHNVPSILTETALYNLATPGEYTLEDIPEDYRDFTKSAFYTTPWEGGWWRIGDAVQYCLTASRAVLDAAARYRSDMLLSKRRLARENMERFRTEAPYGWLIPADQPHGTAAARMLDKLMLLGVRAYRATEPFRDGDRTWPEGTLVLPMSQPFAMFLKTMMEPQAYPDLRRYTHLWQGIVSRVHLDTGPLRPYDVAGWTLPLQMGVTCQELSEAPTFAMTPLDSPPWSRGSVQGAGSVYLLNARDNNAWIAVNEVLARGGSVAAASAPPQGTVDQGSRPVFAVGGVPGPDLAGIALETGLTFLGTPLDPGGIPVQKARIGLYQPWTASMDEGWIRWLLEQYRFEYASLHNDRFREGRLAEEMDVIVLPSVSGRSSIIEGRSARNTPEPYAGGIGEEGVAALLDFVRGGGTLVAHGASCAFAIDAFGLPVRNAMRDIVSEGFYAAGSVVRMDYGETWGIDGAQGIAFFSSGDMVFDLGEYDPTSGGAQAGPPEILARFPEAPILLSGYVERDDLVYGRPTALEVPFGRGRIVLIGFSFHNRAQAHAVFPLFFRSLYRWGTERD